MIGVTHELNQLRVASGPWDDGPWTIRFPLFHPRADRWDFWHLSTGPMLLRSDPNRPVMFYNGADKEACWKIGQIAFDEMYTHAVDRSDNALVVPRPVEPVYRDITFANSQVELGGGI